MSKSMQYLVHGYVLSLQQLFPTDNPYYNLYGHSIIISTILVFYDEPELFQTNGNSSFNYIHKTYGSLLHVFGKKVITKGDINKYKWKSKTDEAFNGTFGIIDVEGICNVNNGPCNWLWCNNVKDLAFVGSKRSRRAAFIFEKENTSSFVGFGDTVTIELDYDKDSVSFTSEKSKETKTRKLKAGLKSVKFIAEFDVDDSVISFVE